MVQAASAVRARWEELRGSLPAGIDHDVVDRAFADAEELYGNAVHRTTAPLLEHCLDLLEQLLPFEPDTDLAAVALLHHVPELHAWNFEDIERRYGKRVRAMVGEVHVLRHLTTHNRRVSLERLRLNFFRVSQDVRVFLMMLCHQLLTMRNLPRYPADERRKISGDVLHLYAPAAARLGMYSLKHSLEDAGFPVLYPVDHERITEQMHALREKHGTFLRRTAKAVEEELRSHGLLVHVEGREKHPYSIFNKMRHKTVTHIEGIPDLFALRVIVEGDAACYQALGFLHRMGYPVQNRFKDYIAFPKPNGYQSLHTTLLGLPHAPPGIMVEVQVRTPEMHREAQIGVAAHWSYKEAGKTRQDRSRMLVERAFIPEDDEDRPRMSGVADHMFVLTPKGDVVELPEGATPLDFAFHVHTAVGLSFKAARVNGAVVPMDHHLENGDIIEIIRHKDPRPSPRWISLLKTASARNRLKRHLAVQDRPQLVEDGRDALNRELKRLRRPPLDAHLTLLKHIDGASTTLLEREDFLASIGQGSLSEAAALLRIDDLIVKNEEPAKARVAPGTALVPRVEGSIPMPTVIAKCCAPEPGDALIGVIGRTGDVRIHAKGCKMLRAVNPQRRIHAHWSAPVKRASKR